MKKILAFVLASIMVLSLVPASAFAAITKADCSAGHKNPVKVGGQAATCQQSGYTIYKCNDCGETYVADPVQMLEHNWVSDKENAHLDIEASCLYEQNGTKYVVCANKGCSAAEVQHVYWDSIEVHDLKVVSGIGCEKLYACKTCGEEGYKFYDEDEECVILGDTPGHTWEFDSVIAEAYWENGVEIVGSARYICTADDCVAFKDVDIACPDCKCTTKVLVQANVEPTCVADGFHAVYQCVECGTLYVDYDADNKPETETIVLLEDGADEGDDITVADAIDPKLGHTKPVVTQITRVGCNITYTCTVCKQAVAEVDHLNKVTTSAQGLEANCIRYGINYVTCSSCGFYETEVVPAKGHNSHLAANVAEPVVTVPSTCAVQGGKYIVCADPTCPLEPTTKNGVTARFVTLVEAYPLNLIDGHDIVNQMTLDGSKTSATCTESAINVMVCRNNCAAYATPKVEYAAAKGHTWHTYATLANCKTRTNSLAAWTKATFMYCTACGVKEYDFANAAPTAGVDAVTGAPTSGWEKADLTTVSSITLTFADTMSMLEYHGVVRREWKWNSSDKKDVAVNKETTADSATKEYWRDSWTPENWEGVDGALTYIETVPATCTKEGYVAYICNDCGMPAYVTLGKPKHDKAGGTIPGTEATCNTPGVRESYICGECGLNWAYSKKAGGNVVATDDKQVTNFVLNPCQNLDLKVITNCKGTKYYQCPDCNVMYSDVNCTKPVAPSVVEDHSWKFLATAVPANCGEDGTIGVRYCNTCKKIEAYIVYIVDGEESLITIAPDSGKYDTSGTRTFVIDDATYGVSVDVTIKVPKNGSATFYYSNNVTSYSPTVVKKLDHKHLDGTTAIISNYDHSTSNVADHSEAVFVKEECSICAYEMIVSYVAAAEGHINEDGEVLVDECENGIAIADRLCILCYAANSNIQDTAARVAASTIGDGHTFSTSSKGSTWNCQNAGYSYVECTKCGFFKVSDVVTPADADAFHAQIYTAAKNANKTVEEYLEMFGNYIPNVERVGQAADYAHDGASYWTCAYCDYAYTDLIEADCPGTGLEIYLNADAESYMPGSTIYVTVSFDSLKGVDVWGANFNVLYDIEAVQFVDAKVVADSGFTGTAYAPTVKEAITAINADGDEVVTGYHYVPTGEVNVAVNNIDGELINKETAVIVLEFKVINTNPAVPSTDFSVGNYDNGTQVRYASIVGSNGKEITYIFANDYNECRVSLLAFADLDGQNGTTMLDAFELYYMILNDEYSTIADINADGFVNATDLNMLYDYLIGKITLEDIIYAEEEEEEDDRLIIYDDNGVKVYDSYCDFDGNGKIEGVAENAALSGRIDPALFWATV